ncbi:beta-N-acetylhexosaminidase [Chryseolinea lacunae]|uniref:Beta-N-acetylhexosaminidase n=1 Tax=Chryseolinea lacunae TaxID=2801331 RepID=A0ABS1KU30_9BACT|nr:beta-N-acetylhexosaminidase [Chryseolinea lacunae]MBL0742983.1 beta-N-acetylhexosaminidase [Chryseolinea lacunae]
MRIFPATLFLLVLAFCASAQTNTKDFTVKGFHLDLRIQVMSPDALKDFALRLSRSGINTLIMEWEGTYPFEKHPLIANRYAYSKAEVTSFVSYCKSLGLDVIPLQQSFGHVEYILRHPRYKDLREDQKDYSQVCPLKTELNRELFNDLFTELVSTHPSNYFHIGGDETYLLGHCDQCRLKSEKEGKSKLYIDHIKMLAELVIRLGKRPVLWADIALKYPEALKSLPPETLFIDWNYGWEMNRFGDHQKLMDSGFEIWGAPSLRSHPDNYFLTQWQKHFRNIRDFVPAARQLGYSGIVMTSWSTSGIYSPVFETSNDIVDLYAIRHVYPLSGFSLLLSAYTESLKSTAPLDIPAFVQKYGNETYGFSKDQSLKFWNALRTAPYEIQQGQVQGPTTMSVQNVLDSAALAARWLRELTPSKNKDEFEHYRLMADIRVHYLDYQRIEKQVNKPAFTQKDFPDVLKQLKSLIVQSENLNQRFVALNKAYLHPGEMDVENVLRIDKAKLLYARLSRQRLSK